MAAPSSQAAPSALALVVGAGGGIGSARLRGDARHARVPALGRRGEITLDLVALHPGTVDTALSQPLRKAGLVLQTPDAAAAARLLAVIDGLGAAASGGFFNHDGEALPW